MNQSHPILRSASFSSFKQTKCLLTLILLLSTSLLFAQDDPLHIDPSGNVGIGTNSPTAKLDVIGNAKISGNVGASTLSGTLTGDVNSTKITTSQLTVSGKITGTLTGDVNNDSITTSQLTVKGNITGNLISDIKNGAITTSQLTVNGAGGFSGSVGIGTNEPDFPLDVRIGSLVDGILNLKFADQIPSENELKEEIITMRPISIKAEGGFLAGSGYYVDSDKRIKKSFTVANTFKDLVLLNQLKVTSFQYKNNMVFGNGFTKGLIAQEVEEIFPQAVNKNPGFIPDVYALADKTVLKDGLLTVSLKAPHGFSNGDVVRVITETNETKELALEVKDANTFTIANWSGAAGELFVYGKKVNDFRSVDYQQIFSLGISAIQELSKQMDDLKLENNKLKNDTAAMLQSVTAVQVQLALLQKKVESLLAPAVIAGK